MKIYLASMSPRRKELLAQMEVPFELLPIEISEVVAPNEKADLYSRRITKEKLEASWEKIIQEKYEPLPVLCADTEVILDGLILGKPRDKEEAFKMLKQYSGRTHEVITSVGLMYYAHQKIILNKTQVTFAAMRDAEIKHYLESENYKGKSGGYGIQSAIGQFISRIEGCFYSVMGLPLNTVRTLLNDLEEHLSIK